MKKEDLIILILALLLMAGMLFTIFFGGEESKHGVGSVHDNPHRTEVGANLCSWHNILNTGAKLDFR